MSISFSQHGLKGCRKFEFIDDTIEQYLPTWRNLVILRAPDLYSNRSLQIPYEPIDGTILPAYQLQQQLDEGTYGKIIRAQRALYLIENPEKPTQLKRIDDFADVVCKINEIEAPPADLPERERESWYEEEVQAILHEASLHALAYHTLKSRGFPHAIPQLYEIYANGSQRVIGAASEIQSVVMGMEFVGGETLHTYFAQHLPITTKDRIREANDRLLMEILIQLSIYLEILQTDLRFNHRDLKINNVLRRNHVRPWARSLTHPSLSRPWIAFHDLVIIDFGFACVACDDLPHSLVQAGSWFKPAHDCLKRGRDIALFLHCLQACYPLQERITPALWATLKAATLAIVGNADGAVTEIPLLCTNLDKHGQVAEGPIVFGDGIYKLLRRHDVDVPGCAPATLIASLNALRR